MAYICEELAATHVLGLVSASLIFEDKMKIHLMAEPPLTIDRYLKQAAGSEGGTHDFGRV